MSETERGVGDALAFAALSPERAERLTRVLEHLMPGIAATSAGMAERRDVAPAFVAWSADERAR